jgi:O-antigen ligase
VNLLREDLSEKTADLSIADPRLRRWELALDLVKKAPLTGYGSGDEVGLLKEKYFDNQLYDSYLHRLNAHNQYLSFLLMGGLGALAVYLITLFSGLRLATRQRSFVFLSFVLLLLTVSVSENILSRNKGIFFYSFFFSLFVCAGKKKRKAPVLPQESTTTGNPKRRLHVSTFKI